MKKKGFTLMEMLGVILILAIVAIITIPLIIKVVDSVRKRSARISVEGYVSAIENYVSMNEMDSEKYPYNLKGNTWNVSNTTTNEVSILNVIPRVKAETIEVPALNDIIKIKGTKPTRGTVTIDEKGKVTEVELVVRGYVVEYDGNTYNVLGKYGKVIIDKTKPEVSVAVGKTTSKSILIGVTALDNESDIKEIKYEIDGKTYKDKYDKTKVETTKTFDNLKASKTYTIKITVTNGKGLVEEKEITAETVDLGNLVIKFNKTPNESQNGYFKKLEAYLEYSSEDAEGYYIKSEREADSNVTTTRVCGEETVPGECSDIESTITLESNKWYYFESSPTLTYDDTSTETNTLYARVTNGVSMTSNSSAEISKIDTTVPNVELGITDETLTSISIPITASDEHTGLGNVTCKYSTTENSYTETSNVEATTSNCTISDLTEGTTYYYQVCISDLVGNEKCENGSATTKSLTLKLKATNTPEEAVNGYYKEQVWELETTGEPTGYYIKIQREASSSVKAKLRCGSGTIPDNCQSSETNYLSTNYWYYFEEKPKIIIKTYYKYNLQLYAFITDGKNTTETASAYFSKIDSTSPTLTLGEITTTTNSISIPITASDELTGIDENSITCKYSTKSGEFTSNANSVSTSNCTITGLTSGTRYYYQVCVSDKVGNQGCKQGDTKVGSYTYLHQKVGIGDYIKMTPTSTSYPIDTSLTGYSISESINPSLMNMWRVIKINDNGTIEMVSQYKQGNVHFKGDVGYQKYIGTLNTIAAQFYNNSYTVSSKSAPYFREMGYNGQTANITTDLTSTNSGRTSTPVTITPDGIGQEYNGGLAGDTLYITDMNLVIVAYKTKDNELTDRYALWVNALDEDSRSDYCLASREYKGGGNVFDWRINVISSGSFSYKIVKQSNTTNEPKGNTFDPSCSLRPIITLKANLQTSGGDGQSEATAWTLK